MTIRLHRGDLPDLARYQTGAVAIDTETMGLDPRRDLRAATGGKRAPPTGPRRPGVPNLAKLAHASTGTERHEL